MVSFIFCTFFFKECQDVFLDQSDFPILWMSVATVSSNSFGHITFGANHVQWRDSTVWTQMDLDLNVTFTTLTPCVTLWWAVLPPYRKFRPLSPYCSAIMALLPSSLGHRDGETNTHTHSSKIFVPAILSTW